LEQHAPVVPPLLPQEPTIVGRYAIYDRIAAGGMATVHLGRLVGEMGFSRTVAIKRLHPHLAMDPAFVGMFVDEARLAARIRHPNVVQMLDVVVRDDEVFLVMEYIEGESLSAFMRICVAKGEAVPAAVATALMAAVLRGLHAAHEAKNDHGEPLGLVHRDVSPQNVLIDLEGIARVLDFGVAKALGQSHATRDGQLKGKLAYMAPEQIMGGAIDRRTDVFAAAVVLWEVLAGRRLFKADGDAQVMHLVLNDKIRAPSSFMPEVPAALDALVLKALERDPTKRFETAAEMADALEDAVPPMAPRKLAPWVRGLLGDNLASRARLVHDIESASTGHRVIPVPRGSSKVVDEVDALLVSDAPPHPGSQASSIAVAGPRSGVGARRPRTGTLIAGAVGACVGVLVLVAAFRGGHHTATATMPIRQASPPDTVTSVAAAPPTTGTPASPWETAPPAETVVPVESIPSAVAPAKVASRPASRPIVRPAPTAPVPAPKLYSRY
jgi:serine/threonine protein kinase